MGNELIKQIESNIGDNIETRLREFPMNTLTEHKRLGTILKHDVLGMVGAILDKAKEEWLEVEECDLPLKVNGNVDWQKTAELMELRNLIRNRWFEKWFGQ